MDYFYLSCSLASLVAFAGYIVDRFIEHENKGVTYSLIGSFVMLTIFFWVWFYLSPSNIVRNTIEDRIYAISVFTNNGKSNDIAIVEGTFETSQWEGTIFLPPFAEPPIVILKRPEDYSGFFSGTPPGVITTTDSFSYKMTDSGEQGSWVYRARGELLKRLPQ